jgi:hypothetical protein
MTPVSRRLFEKGLFWDDGHCTSVVIPRKRVPRTADLRSRFGFLGKKTFVLAILTSPATCSPREALEASIFTVASLVVKRLRLPDRTGAANTLTLTCREL